MKRQYLALQAILLLVFGLISCSPDNSPEEQPPQPIGKVGVEIQNQDETIQKIKDTKRLRATSSIALSIKKNDDQVESIFSKTSCKTSFKQEILELETQLPTKEIIQVKDILPAEVFTPSNEQSRQVICQFDIRIKRITGGTVIITLKDIQVLRTDSLVNLELSFLRGDEENYFMKADLTGQRLDYPINEGDVKTLCESTTVNHFYTGQDLLLDQLFNDLVFEKNNLQNCRLYMRSSDSKETWVSDNFYVQNKESKLELHYEYNLKSESGFSYNQEAMLILNIENHSDTESYFKLNIPKPIVQLRPIYKTSSSEPSFYFIKPFTLVSHWSLKGAEIIKKSKQPQHSIYKLRPGQVLEIRLLVDSNVSCPSGASADPQQIAVCAGWRLFHGHNYYFSNFPTITESVFSNYSIDRWNTMTPTPPLAKRKGTVHNIWMPNKFVTKFCKHSKILKDPEKPAMEFTGLAGKKFTCAVN